jgi:hypothetical protein
LVHVYDDALGGRGASESDQLLRQVKRSIDAPIELCEVALEWRS